MRTILTALPLALIALATPATAAPVTFGCTFVSATAGLSMPPSMTVTFNPDVHTASVAFSDGEKTDFASDPATNYTFLVMAMGGNVVASGTRPLQLSDTLMLMNGELTWTTAAHDKPETNSTWACKPA